MKPLCLFLLCVVSGASPSPNKASHLERDVCIIGGGASGMYAAVRLQQMGMSVALIEKQPQFGGHVDTYVDPASGQPYDYGVQVFSNISVLSDFFAHFDVPLAPLDSSGGGTTKYVNFETGAEVPSSELIGGNITTAWIEYTKQQAKYPTIFEEWDLPYPIPKDLLMPFGDFIRKYNLEAMAYQAFQYDQGAGNILSKPTLYMMKYQDQVQMQSFFTNGFVYNGLGSNQELYDRAQAELEPNVYLNSDVKWIHRKKDRVEVCFSTGNSITRVKAAKLLISIPPKLSNLRFLDLDRDDRELLGQFNNSYYWDALLRNTGIPAGTSLTNVNPDAALNIPAMPGVIGIGATPIQGVYAAYYNSPHYVSDGDVKKEILATLARARKGLGYPRPEGETEFVGFNNHSPFVLTVSNKAIKNGFYKKLLALQGKDRTWWTGATWMNQATTTVWKYTEDHVLPALVNEN